MIHYLVHGAADTVGVTAVDVKKGQSLKGWDMTTDKTLGAKAAQKIPLGHKIALIDIAKGDEVVKYNETIGVATKPIKKGQHVHTHNLKTTRW